jgi:hypothetical protein
MFVRSTAFWQVAAGSGQRKLIETTMGRYKTPIEPRLRARGFAVQQTEATMGVAALNQMLAVGRPKLSAASTSWHDGPTPESSRTPSGRCTNAGWWPRHGATASQTPRLP